MLSATGRGGAVAAAHPAAVEAGLDVLRAGGNAVDAAVATAFALTVVDPGNASLGGRGSMLVHLAKDGRLFSLDFNTVCPRLAGPDVYEVVPTRAGEWWSVKDFANTIGHRAVSLPGTAAGLCAAATRYGTMPLDRLTERAAELAEGGFAVPVSLEMSLAGARERLLRHPASAAVFAPRGRTLRRGELLANPDLARTLRRLGREGADCFYRGELARAIVEDMRANGGLLTAEDLAEYRVKEHDPAKVTYRDHEVAVTPVCTGGPAVLQALNILEGFDLPDAEPFAPSTIHLAVEAMKLTWADRFAYVADPAFVPVPLAGLLSKEYAATRRAVIDPGRANPAPAAGDPWPFDGGRQGAPMPPSARRSGAGGDTTYCCAWDAAGNVVSLTHTLCGSFGSGVMVPGTGVLLNNGMYWFDPRPGSANSIAPGKVPLNNQAETIVLREGKPVLAIGSPGGRRLVTTIILALSRILDHGFTPAEALAAPRLHVEDREPVVFERSWLTSVAGGMELLLDLQDLGHELATLGITDRFISGPAHAIGLNPATGELCAAGDPRQPGAAGVC